MAVHDPDLLDALEALGTESFHGTVWRHMFNDNPPELANTRGARWNPPGLAAVYVSLERDTAVAEGQYAIDSQPLRPRATRVVYQLRVTLTRVVRINESNLAAIGLTPDLIANDDYAACQAVGAAVAFLGYDGLMVPSARADGTNVVILVNELDADSVLERVASEIIETA